MSECNFILQVSLTNADYFEFIALKTGWGVSELNVLKVDPSEGVPVYSAARVPVAFVPNDMPKIILATQESKVLSFANDGDGSAGTNFVIHDRPFYVSNSRTCFRVKRCDVDIRFILASIQSMKAQHGFNYAYKANLTNLKNVNVSFPVDMDGNLDIDKINSTTQKYNVIFELKVKIDEYEERLKNLTVLIENESTPCKAVRVGDIFETKKGFSRYTKTYGQLNSGAYPVYSASNIAPLTFIDSFDYEGKYLTWATNGFAGYIKVIDGQFSINGDRGLLIPKHQCINIDYIRVVLEPILRELAKGRKGDNGENEFTKVYPLMVENVILQIPVLPDGGFDVTQQNEIAESYHKVEEVKRLLLVELQKIKKISIEL